MRRLLTISIAVILSGCMVGPDYKEASQSVRLPDTLKEEHFNRDEGLWKSAIPADTLPKGDWWSVFGDKDLDGLLKKCAENNPDLAAAYQRVEQARESALMQKSDLYPELQGNAYYSRTDSSKNLQPSYGRYDTWLAGFGITWDLDLFGRVRSLLQAEVANAQAQLAAYESLMLNLQSNVAKTYFLARSLKSEVNVLEDTLKIRREDTKLVEKRLQMDYSTKIDLKRAQQQEHDAASQLADAKRQLFLARNYLALLVGCSPSELEADFAPLGKDFPKIPAAIPSELLERRPDIAEAERKVYAANARIGAAQAAFFPTVSITANTDLSANKIDKLLNSSSFAWGISPQIYIPIFEAGRNIAQKRVALAAHQEALENYRSVVLSAIREVEDSMVNISYMADEYKEKAEMVDAAKEVQRMTRIQYEQGYTDYFSVSEAQRLELTSVRELIVLQGERFSACVDLIASLGGGWKLGEKRPENIDGRSTDDDFGQNNILPNM